MNVNGINENINQQYDVISPGNVLKSFKPLISEVCELILAYRQMVPVIPELCLPTATKEIAFTPILFQAANNIRIKNANSFWPVSEVTVLRKSLKAKGRIDLGLFSKRHISLIECKVTRVKVKSKDIASVRSAMENAEKQLLDVNLKNLFFKTTDEQLRNYRKHNKLVSIVTANITTDVNNNKADKQFFSKLQQVRNEYPSYMIAWVKYEPHRINQKNDGSLLPNERTLRSIGQIMVIREVFGNKWG